MMADISNGNINTSGKYPYLMNGSLFGKKAFLGSNLSAMTSIYSNQYSQDIV